ncbi:MAG: hypothetical protein JW863_11050 [Chitinispirillaceae bacterium]|nr:hypothetical protein [Chitinispirillaceae bacterium]
MSAKSDKRLFLVMNPASRDGKSERTFATIRNYFDDCGMSYGCGITESLDHATTYTRTACTDHRDIVVAVGGDGTINRVINGFFSPEGKLLSPHTKLGIIHTGTSPDFCKSYGIPTTLVDACRTVFMGSVRNISIGMIRYHEQHRPQCATPGTSPVAFFGCCANIGLGASLAQAANSGIRKILGDTAGTFTALLRVLATYRSSTITVDIDGQPVTHDKVFNISIGRTYHIASGIKITNDLTDSDDRLYALTVSNLTFRSLPGCLTTLYSGKPVSPGAVFRMEYGREFTVTSPDNHPVAVEFDGDPAGYLPCTITTAPDHLPLICGGIGA